MVSPLIETDESGESRTVALGTCHMLISHIEVDFDGLYQEWLESAGKAINRDEYNQASDSPWASPDNVRPLCWLEQRAVITDGQGVSGQRGQENAGVSFREHPVVLEQSKFGERATKNHGKEMEVGGKGSSLIR